jgi:DNA modification methylase
MSEVQVADCVSAMAAMQAESVDLVFADPPFNIGHDYGEQYDDTKTDEDYLTWSRRWLTEVKRVLKSNGSFWLAIGDGYAAELDVLCRLSVGFHRRSWVIWYYTFGQHGSKKFTPSHTHIFHYVVNKKQFTFNGDAIKVPSLRQTKYKDKRAKEGGRLPDDTWQIPRLCGTFKERLPHPCQMPEAILDRIVRVSSNKGDLVFDPFAGSGTTLAVAKKLGRQYAGCDISPQYAKIANERLSKIPDPEPPECPAASQSPQTACS